MLRLLFPLTLIAFSALGVLLMSRREQKKLDHNRRHYRLYFPLALDADSVTGWVRSISGTLKSHHAGVSGTPTVAFELWATSEGIQHRLKIPWQQADYVVGQLRSLVPGIRVEPEDNIPYRRWTTAVEIGLSRSSHQLRIYNTSTTATSLLASVQAVEPGETVMMQWIISPSPPAPLPTYDTPSDAFDLHTVLEGSSANRDEIKDRREKLSEPNVLAVLRVASVAQTKIRAIHLIYRVRASLASSRSPHTKFQKRFATHKMLQGRIDLVKTPLWFPMVLSSTEVAALVAWPIDNPFITGLPPALARQLPAPEAVPRTGRVIGRSNFPGNERPVAIGFEDVRKHVHVLGPSGVGKSTMLANMMKQDMEEGYGVILIENKGDLFESAMNYVPKTRLDDVIVVDVNDRKNPVGFNILQQGHPLVVVDELVALFERLYRGAGSVWTREVLYHALRTLVVDPSLTFVDLAALLVPMSKEESDWADKLIRSLTDRELRNFWQRFHNQPRAAQDRITQPVMDRIWQLNARPELRNIIGQSNSSFKMADVFEHNKILLINLTGLPRETASLTGTLFMNALWHAVKTVKPEKPTYLYLDEFQDFIDLPIDPEELLTKARSFGLGMTLAHQHLAQLPSELKSAVMANARSKIVFQATADDANKMAKEFGTTVSEADFMHLGRYEALARIATDDGISSPLTLTASPPAPPHSLGRQVESMSRHAYGVPVGKVEAEINERRKEAKAPASGKRPSIGTLETLTETQT